jgi:hypothetical protein
VKQRICKTHQWRAFGRPGTKYAFLACIVCGAKKDA